MVTLTKSPARFTVSLVKASHAPQTPRISYVKSDDTLWRQAAHRARVSSQRATARRLARLRAARATDNDDATHDRAAQREAALDATPER